MRVPLVDDDARPITPEGCDTCGVPKRSHGQRYTKGSRRSHAYVAPSHALIAQRARALRAAKDRQRVAAAEEAARQEEQNVIGRWLHEDVPMEAP